ncbi:MAG TPA: ABATE domain-containing protein [Gammaproteobacteria bacterium]|nr:ABATE domain-containing protein [Gammaproteobacteria bacterium]
MEARTNQEWLERIELIGGTPCLDFVNSVGDCIGPRPLDHLQSYADLLFWLQRCQLLPAAEAARLTALSRRSPRITADALRHAQHFRDAAWRLLAALVRDTAPAPQDLADVNRVVERAYAHMQLEPQGAGFRLARRSETDLEQAVWPAARALAEFLGSAELGRLRMCADEACGWLFVDRSRNGLRRWCSMRDCGNRAKVREHYRRTHLQ